MTPLNKLRPDKIFLCFSVEQGISSYGGSNGVDTDSIGPRWVGQRGVWSWGYRLFSGFCVRFRELGVLATRGFEGVCVSTRRIRWSAYRVGRCSPTAAAPAETRCRVRNAVQCKSRGHAVGSIPGRCKILLDFFARSFCENDHNDK